ncbi:MULTISPECIES: UvrD-helicase domain-containing protein [Pectobacterium]|uniref:UvrD-helicase domain-containing protein n=1 Tax=Pectobacterium TaxID=122277 RepID=UPI000473ED58|nr:UvrD-helicase domain-containing protein [Pectobacterium parmentieri]MBI0473226.1 AAA family ATPase [Pectobacterium parmentieri]MBI0495839.1 AAA family ATPase [Pectobacterium parmentieri]MBI0570376.1 AAA family ATPase [Pectobacterium parmentieri]MBI0575081.1 AAA family ATPase [Pectobacterium parmentieri]
MSEDKKMNIEFVRAGAGSGKTHYLTHLLASRLEDKSARASSVIATTFTVKAATELRERARSTLLKKGRLDLAATVGQARIGTINSVCGQLIQRFCFDLGVSPDQRILDEQQASKIARVALESVQTPEEIRRLITVAHRLGIGQAKFSTASREQKREAAISETLRKLMDAARENNLSPKQLAAMGAKNADAMLATWPVPVRGVSANLTSVLDLVIAELQVARVKGNTTDVLRKAIDRCRDARELLGQGRLPWSEWVALAKLNAGAPQKAIVAPLHTSANLHGKSAEFHQDVREYLLLLFGIASRGLQAFEEAKREMGVVDFTDQEVLLLRGLETSEVVQQALREELDLVLVDEFQDTNPLQLAIFIELAKLAKSSVWVGDRKQAIYGFRGTDSTLIQQVLDSVEAWGGKVGAALTDSYRSTPALVKLTNEAFVSAFSQTPEAEIALTPIRCPIADSVDLQNWTFASPPGKRILDVTGLGPVLTQFLRSKAQIYDKDTKSIRDVQPGDIAILCRTNSVVKDVVGALSRWGIPVAAERPGLLATPEAQLVIACLRRLHDRSDTVASAVIVGLTGALEPEQWLHDRLQFLADAKRNEKGEWEPPLNSWRVEGAGTNPLLARLESLRDRLLSLTPFESLRLAKAESGIANFCHSWSVDKRSAEVRLANVEQLLSLSRQYEEECLSSSQPATVNGLLLWLQKLDVDGKDGRAAANHEAVEVMTFHGAKGLEWPVVIVVGLDHPSRTDLWEVRARTEGVFNASVPLANRFIHFWPYPFGATKSVDEVTVAEATSVGKAAAKSALEENQRLLYVTLTRARDQIVLVSKPGTGAELPPLDWLRESNAIETFWPRTMKRVIDGFDISCFATDWTLEQTQAEPPVKTEEILQFYPLREPKQHMPLWVRPSATQGGSFKVHTVETVGSRIVVQAHTDMAMLGSALHNCVAYAVADPMEGITLDDVREILNRWGVGAAIDPQDALDQVNAFINWCRDKWPDSEALAEVPFEARRADGAIARGQIDFLLKVAGGYILFDHKANPRSAGDDDRLAFEHGRQLAEYAQAVAIASGEEVLERWLFLPVAAQAARIVEG